MSAGRQDSPNASTGWWPPEVIEQFRKVTVTGLQECAREKHALHKARAAAAAAAAATATATPALDDPSDSRKGAASGDGGGHGVLSGDQAKACDGTKRNRATGDAESLSVISRSVHERPSMSREEFAARLAAMSSGVKVIPAQPLDGGDGYYGGEQQGPDGCKASAWMRRSSTGRKNRAASAVDTKPLCMMSSCPAVIWGRRRRERARGGGGGVDYWTHGACVGLSIVRSSQDPLDTRNLRDH